MDERAELSTAAVAHPGAAWAREQRELAIFSVATAAAWLHTVDEIRIGELVAVPFGAANLALLAAWRRLSRGWRAAASIAFGLFWALCAIPYHVVPLLGGTATGQNLSGLTRVIGGAAMVGVGIAVARRRR